jgi:hypothetical protein
VHSYTADAVAVGLIKLDITTSAQTPANVEDPIERTLSKVLRQSEDLGRGTYRGDQAEIWDGSIMSFLNGVRGEAPVVSDFLA